LPPIPIRSPATATTFFAALVERPVFQVVGAHISTFVVSAHRRGLALVLEQGLSDTVKHTLRLDTAGGSVPAQITLSPLSRGDHPTCCAVVVDLREREQAERARAARAAAEEANAAKDRFLAVLGTSLARRSTVLGWAQILAGRSDRYALEHRGARVDTVQTAAAALDRLAMPRCCVLVSDSGCPRRTA
jgi:hypothetical protein